MDRNQIQYRHFNSAVQVRAAENENEEREITGTAIVFDSLSRALYSDEDTEIREVIAREAVTRDLLDSGTILMTLFHNNEKILARSREGKGTLHYDLTDEGVTFRFTPPDTEDGRTALALVERGDITGCSFAFRADYWDRDAVEKTVETKDGKEIVTYTVKRMIGIYDFTLTPTPVYEDTEVAQRALDFYRADGGAKAPSQNQDNKKEDDTKAEEKGDDETWKKRAAELRAAAKIL